MHHKVKMSLLAGTVVVLAGCASNSDSNGGAETPPGVATLHLDWQLAQPGHYASNLAHGLLLTDSATIQAGQPNIKTIAAVDPLTRKLAWSVPTAPGRVNGGRTSFAELGENIVALIYNPVQDQPSDYRMAIYSPQGVLLRTVPLPGLLRTVGYTLGPWVNGDQLVVAGGEHVYAYEAASLTTDHPVLRWQRTYGDPQQPGIPYITAVITDDQGNVYVGTQDNRVRALSPDGSERWSLMTAPTMNLSTAPYTMGLHGNRLYIQAGTAGLQAYDTTSGNALWSKATTGNYCPRVPGIQATHMEIGGGKIYLGLNGGDCIPAFNESDGTQAWAFTPPFQATFFNQPVYVRGVLYATNGQTYAIDTATGKQMAQAQEETADTFLGTLRYDERTDDVLVWSGFNLYAYKALK